MHFFSSSGFEAGRLRGFRFLLLLPMVLVLPLNARAQHTVGRWTLGVRGGINSFFTDFNESLIGPGFDATGRFGIARNFSVGATLGYEELKTHLDPNVLGLPYDYVKLHAFPLTVNGYYHAFPGNKFSPYFTAGIGLLMYERLDWKADGLPDKGIKVSVDVPVGLGMEYFLNSHLSLNAELGYRILDDKTETVTEGGFDSFATLKAGAHLYFGSSDEDDDDQDGLNNGDEARFGTDKLQPDTDNDGIKDGDEVHMYGSNPLAEDTDGDGLSDSEEVFQWKTSPVNPDTDHDGLTDGDEKTRGTNPISQDTDGDVLLDGEEVAMGTNPLMIDTDSDGLSDYMESRTLLTNPLLADTDQDSLDDGSEVSRFQTDPLKADTDGGGVIDGIEIENGTDPLIAEDDKSGLQTVPGEPIVVSGIRFAPGGAVILHGSETALEDAFITLVLLGNATVDIVGYTDNSGQASDNLQLSQARADAVLTWFVNQGIDASRLRAVGKGEARPIAPNTTAEGRALNQRIELEIRK